MRAQSRRGFSLLEVAVSLAIVAVLLAVLIPTLRTAQAAAQRETCAANLRTIGIAWDGYLQEHQAFPWIALQSGWQWGGVRFSPTTGRPHIDMDRPINRYLPVRTAGDRAAELFCCPGDCGITHPHAHAAGTGERTAFESFGTSYRANTKLMNAAVSADTPPRGLRLSEILSEPDSVVILGDAVWFEIVHDTGRRADWHRTHNAGNMLFLDGSVRFITMDMDSKRIEAMFRPTVAE